MTYEYMYHVSYRLTDKWDSIDDMHDLVLCEG